MEKKQISDVKEFWENNPLWTGESNYKTGSENSSKSIERYT